MASVASLGVHEPAGLHFAIAEGILPPNPSPELYDWKVLSDEHDDDELFSTESCVIWSRGGEVGRCLRFDIEKEPILTSLLAYFPTSEDDVHGVADSVGQAFREATAGYGKPERAATPGRVGNPEKPQKWTPPLAKSLVVFLKTQAHVYSFSGGEHVVHMPFEVDAAIAAPRGVIIQRKSKVDTTVPVTMNFPRAPPNSFVSSQTLPAACQSASQPTMQAFSTAGLGKPKPLPLRLGSTLETMWGTPLETGDPGWPRLVCLTDPMSELGLVVAQSDKPTRDRYPKSSVRTPFLDPAEEILHVEAIHQGRMSATGHDGAQDDLILAVTANRETSMYSVWRMAYLNGDDKFIRRQRVPKSKNTRRRSSAAPGLASGATTPHHASFRESIGSALAGKKPRKSDRVDKGDGVLEKALNIDGNHTTDRRQSRRASSLLARADLSTSHERPLFIEQPTAASSVGRRVDSHGSQRGRNSSSYAAGSANLPFSQTLNSLLEAPVDGLLEELRSGGDFEGFHSMGLDDPEFDSLTKEILFTKIHSMSMDTANIRYSLSSLPATKLCKVFVIVGTPYSVDEQDRNYLLICIQDVIDKRLQLLTLHIQNYGHATRVAGDTTSKTSITWGQHRRAQNVVDSCVIYDGDQAMILILSEDDNSHRQLSIQAPWSELTSIFLPPLSVHNRDMYALDNSCHIFQTGREGKFGVAVSGLRHPRANGLVDVVDNDGRPYQVQIQLEPKSLRVRRVLNALRSIFPASHSEKMVLGWWQMMQWLETLPDVSPADKEWTALITELFLIFLVALYPDDTEASFGDLGQAALGHTTSDADKLLATNPDRPWTASKAWSWASSATIHDATETCQASSVASTGSLSSSALTGHIRFAKAFLATKAGEQAIGRAGYLPTALGESETSRKKAVWGITMALHLCLEEERLDILASTNSSVTSTSLKAVVWQLCHWLNWPSFAEWYALELNDDSLAPSRLPGTLVPHSLRNMMPPEYSNVIKDPKSSSLVVREPDEIPSIFEWIRLGLIGAQPGSFPSLKDVYSVLSQQNHKEATRGDEIWKEITPRTLMFRQFFHETKACASSAEVVEAMHKCGFTLTVIDTLPEGVATPFQDAIARCQQHPPRHWAKEMYDLIGRGDINMVLKANSRTAQGLKSLVALHRAAQFILRDADDAKDDLVAQTSDEPESEERQAVIHAIFRDDKRLYEAQNILSSSKPRVVRLNQQAGWSEPEYLERQKELVTTIATSTLATSAGRGMLNYGFRFPLLTQKFNVQGFNLTCIVKPTNVAVGVDKAMFTEERVNWAFFHQGVAYGLAISARAKGIDTSWIVFNKPETDLSHRHAGFLLALGLNGHLKSVAKWVAFKYLTPKHMMTSIGLLLGLAVSHIGTMDSLITRLLSVHVTRMLPRGAAELNLSRQIQTTGVMGIGLLYYNSQHRRMSEIMMSEIEYMDDVNEEDPLRNEGYRLAAGFALGFINLGKGHSRKGLLDMQITEQLLSLASSTKKVELANIFDRSAAAATVSIALIYMKTEDHVVARKIAIPDSVLQFDYVRPDILLLRTLAENLIMWSKVQATFDWMFESLPAEFRKRYLLTGVETLQSVDVPFYSIIAGLCFAAALRFSGSANLKVRDMLVHYLDKFIHIVQDLPTPHFDSMIAQCGARMCLDVLALSCATVMAGTGDLVVFRRLRALHGRDDTHTTYGSHMAAHLAIGALFLGSGTTSFGNSNLAVAALLVSFYPIFPASIQDNDAHLQALRHFWVLATEPRCLVTKDASTGQPISVPILVYLKPSALSAFGSTLPADGLVLRRETPCLLPPLDDINTVRTDASAQGFWDLDIGFEKDLSLKSAFQLNQNLYLRRRPANENAFATTLQALSVTGPAANPAGGTSRTALLPSSTERGNDPLEWILRLHKFTGLSRTERALILGMSGAAEDDNSSVGSLSNTIDARLSLASCLDGWRRDNLLDLRLLFDWADQRGRIRDDGKHEGSKNRKAAAVVDEDVEENLLPYPNGTEEKARWWMGDSAIDMLKGKAWVAGQEG